MPAGTGATKSFPGPATAYGAGVWDPVREIYAFGFLNAVPTGPPTMAQTDLTGKDIDEGFKLTLMFQKEAGRRINFFALLAETAINAKLFVTHDGATLTDATWVTVTAQITDPVRSASGDVGAAFGFIADCSSATTRDYHGAIFATTMHWLDVQPPTLSGSTLAGLNANGSPGVTATFDGLFPLSLLRQMGITDPYRVAGYIDTAQILPGSTTATFTTMGISAWWNAGFYRYRITNSGWSRHNILYGRAVTRPGKAAAKSPKGLISARKPTFRWKAVGGAARYEVRVYRGSKLLFKRANLTKTSWKCTRKLPRKLALKWKVRASNSAGAGAWSTALKFRIR